jgi:hypothetical protein
MFYRHLKLNLPYLLFSGSQSLLTPFFYRVDVKNSRFYKGKHYFLCSEHKNFFLWSMGTESVLSSKFKEVLILYSLTIREQ